MIPYYARTMTTFHHHTVISPTLIGREGQLALLTDRLTHTRSGRSRVALLAGEAGIGKSRLVAESKALAAQHGVRSVQGHCFEQDRAFPYAPLIDLLRAFCAGRSTEALTRALAESASELVKIFPELSSYLPNLTPTPTLEPEQEKRRLFQAFTQFLHQLTTAGQPLLIVFEDLHWCDDTSLDWLLSFVRKLTTQPLLVLLTYRNDEVQPALKQLLAAFDRLPLVSEVVLAPLTRANVDTMLQEILALAQPPQVEFVDRLYALTDGNSAVHRGGAQGADHLGRHLSARRCMDAQAAARATDPAHCAGGGAAAHPPPERRRTTAADPRGGDRAAL